MATVSSPLVLSKVARKSFLAFMLAVAGVGMLQAQVPGRNVNMVSGTRLPDGDPYLQRQNEPSVAASTRNPLHLLAGANDYRTVDIPGLPGDHEVGDAWMGLFKSFDGGSRWSSTLVPGYPQDTSTEGKASPLKGYTAAADPVVRAGTNGLFYYSGIVFDRGEEAGTGRSAMFVARFLDHNTDTRDTIAYAGTTLIEVSEDPTVFIDKPWLATDVPRAGAGTCRITSATSGAAAITQTIPAGAAYAVFSKITTMGSETKSQVFFKRSDDCGETWSAAVQLSSIADPINQGATLAIDPYSGTIYVAWRRFTADGTDDSIMVVRSLDQGRKWDPPGRARRIARGKAMGLQTEVHGKKFTRPSTLTDLSSLDQSTLADRFRSNAYPSMTVDDQGRIYIVWAERGFAPSNPDPDQGDARILLTTSHNGSAWTEPIAVDNPMTIALNGGQLAMPGHQLMPSITFSGGKLMLAYYDFRFDVSNTFGQWIDEGDALFLSNGQPRPQPRRRHTVDVRAVQGAPGDIPVFGRSVQVSEYLLGKPHSSNQGPPAQLQFNPPNLPLFKLGEVPFMGDYIDLTPSPAYVTDVDGSWRFNTAPTSSPLFHVVWTDNRDVVPPAPGTTWKQYTPPTQPAPNPPFTPPGCVSGNAGMRNQNIYTARLTGGIIAGAPDNSKILSPTVPRGFAVYAQNATDQPRIFLLAIQNQPLGGGRASFTQSPVAGLAEPYTALYVEVPRRSTIARTVYVTASNPSAQVQVSVTEVSAVNAPPAADALQTVVVLNPDISNPDISNPDISNPDISNPDISNPDISNPDISNPDISNPDISNPDISNPDISNPDISNPDISNVQVANPDISNPDISNPDISNPDISNPDISNPDISNPDISNQSLTDTTWTVSNGGNTPVAYDVELLMNGDVPEGIVVQLILHKQYVTPAVVGCSMVEHTTNVLLANILNPQFSATATEPDVLNPSVSNATLVLGAGESARITLRVLDVNIHDGNVFNAAAQVSPAVVSQPQYLVNNVLQHTVAQEAPSRMLTFLQVPTAGLVSSQVDPVIIRATNGNGSPAPGATIALNRYRLGSTTPVATQLTSTANADGLAFFNLGTFATPGTYHVIASWTDQANTVRAQSSTFDILSGALPGTVFLVSSAADTGPGTLRQAILSSNGKAGTVDTISFAPSVTLITPASPLPALTDPAVIGATTCTGAPPAIEIRGGTAGALASGLVVTGSNSTIRGVSITGFARNGIELRSGANKVECSYIGLQLDGTTARGNAGNGIQIIDAAANVIGGSTSSHRNLISANTGEGIRIDGSQATGNVIRGNFIGTDVNGTADRGNGASGVYIRRAPATSVLGNLISGNNGFAGIAVCGAANWCGGTEIIGTPGSNAAGTEIHGNLIGTNNVGTSALPNLGYGISLDDTSGSIVGTTTTPNTVASNGADGVVIFGATATGNRIVANSIHDNAGLGIDIVGADGPDPNDAGDTDIGPNGRQNSPVLTGATLQAGGTTRITGSLNSTINVGGYDIHFYVSPSCDASGRGEGQTYFTELINVMAESGTVAIDLSYVGLLSAGQSVTATARNRDTGDSSEFSNCAIVQQQPPALDISPVVQWTTADGGNGNYYQYIREQRSWSQAVDEAAARTHNGIRGRLVTIGSDAENQFVNSLRGVGDADMRAWIGFYDPDGEGGRSFEWITGEAVTYTNWNLATGEPNNPASEFWVEMFRDTTWNNITNSGTAGPSQGYVVEYQAAVPAPTGAVTGNLTFNSPDVQVGRWTQGTPQTFRLRVDMDARTTSLTINGVAVGTATFNSTSTALGSVSVELGTTGTQRFAWDDILVRDAAGTATRFRADFSGDMVDQAPSAPSVGTWTIPTGNSGPVLVRASAGGIATQPVELAQNGSGTNLVGTVMTPPPTGVWVVEWKSAMAAPGTGYPSFIFAPIVIRDTSGGIIASVEYR